MTVAVDQAKGMGNMGGGSSGGLLAENNLSDLQSASTARGNLGLGSSAVTEFGEIPKYANFAALPAAPDAAKIIFAALPRLCGNGFFVVMWNGSRWGVLPGQSIIRDAGPSSAGYDLTATGTAFVSLASDVIPADMIGDGEEWAVSGLMRNNGVWGSGSDTIQVRWQSLTTNGTLLSSAAAGAANRVARGEGRFVRLGGTISRSTNGITYSNVSSLDQSLDLSVAQTIEVGMTPGASGNTMRVRFWSMWRVS